MQNTKPPFRAIQEVLARQRLEFWRIHQMSHGARRRQKMLEWLRPPSETGLERRIPVNNRWQANLADPDLQHLLKKGVLLRHREGGGRRHPLNRSSGKRQTYLILA